MALKTERFSTPVNRELQHNFDILTTRKKINALLEPSQLQQRLTLLLASQHESGAWLKALPSQQLGSLLDKRVLLSVCLRISCEICQLHSCICNASVDRLSHHGLLCIKNSERFSRHNKISMILKRELSSTYISCMLKSPDLLRCDRKQ